MKERLKVGILTLPPVSNYGGIMQNYALQQALIRLGFDVITINRTRNKVNDFRYFLARMKFCVLGKFLKRKYLHFSKQDKIYVYQEPQCFVKKYINISGDLENDIDLENYFDNKNYHGIIVGSDQVWRPDYTQNIYNYFLSFLGEDKRILRLSYAASFGKEEWGFDKEQTERCRELIESFDAVSVREDDGVNLCKEYFGRDAEHVLDPTMLLNRDHYLSQIDFSKVSDRKGIFTYFLDNTQNKANLVREVKSKLNLPVYSNQPKSFIGDVSLNINDYYTPSVEGWIKAFDQADYVLTDSFHGTVFAIIFNKQFIAVGNRKKGMSRFNSLLKMFDLEDRLIDDQNIDRSRMSNIFSNEIDYATVNDKLKNYQESSFDFLRRNLKH